MHAIVKVGSSQFLISEGQEFVVDKQNTQEKSLIISDVLLVADGEKVQVGTPILTDYQVVCEILGEVKSDKVKVSKYKAKSRYRKSIGFRAKHTKLRVESIKKTRETKA